MKHLRPMLHSIHRRQEGQNLLLVLIVLAFGSLLIVPSLGFMYTGVKSSLIHEESLFNQYTADSGVENAIARLKYEGGFADSINVDDPVCEYGVTANNRQADVRIEYVEQSVGELPEGGPQSWRIQLSKSADPASASPGQRLTISYTITARNAGTSTIHAIEIGDRLPAGFQDIVYEAGSSSGISNSDPEITIVDGRTQLRWDLGTNPGYRLSAGETYTQQFRVTVTVMWDTYLNLAWIVCAPESIGYVSTGDTAPVEAARLLDIRSSSGTSTVTARVGLAPGGDVAIISWHVT